MQCLLSNVYQTLAFPTHTKPSSPRYLWNPNWPVASKAPNQRQGHGRMMSCLYKELRVLQSIPYSFVTPFNS